MGRLRGGNEAAYFQKIAAEVTELFGTLDCSLYRHYGAEDTNLALKDPVWDEPSTTPAYKKYDLPCSWFGQDSLVDASEFGRDITQSSRAYLALLHLIQAGAPLDQSNDYVETGDILAIHNRCGHEVEIYDIIQVVRAGWVNSSDQFTGYDLELKRRDKYVPERKTQDD